MKEVIEGEKIFSDCISGKRLVSEMKKRINKDNSSILKWAKEPASPKKIFESLIST